MAKEIFKFKVTEDDRPKRLDKFLVEKFPQEYSRSFLQKAAKNGGILLNGAIVKNHHMVRPGDEVAITMPEVKVVDIAPENIPLKIVYEDEDIVIVNKAADMVVHPAPGNYNGTLVNALLWRCKKLSGVGGVSKPGIVHRLDKGTSGILVVAKTDEAHRRLSRQFAKKTNIKRVYIALVKGIVQLDNGSIELPIGRSIHDRKKMAVKFENAKTAVTHYKVLERFKKSTMVEITLGTGRTHQIRVHMSHIGHPVLGDIQYGSSAGILNRPALHAKTLGFMHPSTNKYVEFTSDLPKDIKNLIKRERT